ncbi:hypothetical protein SUGI_0814140 [Cryptomeria japonica]|nr:hypothetical protein SUGI_0814140 [Cryptomeria japonica]
MKKKFTCHGLSKTDCNKLRGVTANGEPIEVHREECGVLIKDNESNVRLQRLVSGDNLKEFHYNLGKIQKILKNKWRLVFLGQNTQDTLDTLHKFRDSMAEKWGGCSSDKIISINNEGELNKKLSKVEKDRPILLCVMEKNGDSPFYRALKREAELEKGILTKCCDLKNVQDYVKHQEYNVIIYNLWQEMIARLGAYEKNAYFLHSALPSRFGNKCKIMYLGCNVINSDPQVTVMVGNISSSDCSASQYKSRVASGVDIQKLPDIFSELLKKYKDEVKSFPERIILFREGFIKGRAQETLLNELNDLRARVDTLAKDEVKCVHITFIVRHKNGGTISVSVPDRKASYSIFSDENGLCYSEFETLVRNLSYSRRYPEPLPAYYSTRAAKLAQVYLEGKENVGLDKMDEIAKAIDRSLCVIGERKQQQGKDQGAGEEMEE